MPVFHCALPLYLQGDLERVEGRALPIICAGLDYKEALHVTGKPTIPTIISYNETICNSTLTSTITDKASCYLPSAIIRIPQGNMSV